MLVNTTTAAAVANFNIIMAYGTNDRNVSAKKSRWM